MAHHDTQYINLVKDVLENGSVKTDRTGTGTISVFDRSMRFDLRDGTIPLLTTKKMGLNAIIHELIWYISGEDNTKYLTDNNVKIWNEWIDAEGNLRKMYGYQWRHWNNYDGTETDQLAELIHNLKTNPDSRRLMVSAWNVADVPNMNLPPCHYGFQCWTRLLTLKERVMISTKTFYLDQLMSHSEEEINSILDGVGIPRRELSLKLTMRSNDVGLGNPFNIVQYSILLRMLCEVVGMAPGDFVWSGADVHIYSNHIEALTEQITRTPLPSPTFSFGRKITSIDDFKFDDFLIRDYKALPSIKMPVAV
jgi:thymidylate synthase